MAIYCSSCGKAANADDQFCASCGRQLIPAATAADPASGPAVDPFTMPPVNPVPRNALEDHIAAMLCYLPFFGWIPAIIFLFTDPYRHNRGLRFHAFQSIFCFAGILLVDAALGLITLGVFPLFYTLHQIFYLAVTVLFVVMMIKTYQRQTVKLPLVGDWAAKQA